MPRTGDPSGVPDASARRGIGAVVMAAGAGRRMGGVPKSLLMRDGEPLLLRQIRLALESGVAGVAVVLGHHAGRLRPVLEAARSRGTWGTQGDRVAWTTNPDPDRGTGSSLRCGLAALPAGLDVWLVLLGDQPLLEAGDVRAVLAAWRSRAVGIELVVPRHAGQPGHPIAFGGDLRDAVLAEQGGIGVREWRRVHPDRVAAVPVVHARCTTDIDVPADLDRLDAEQRVRLAWPDGFGPPAQRG